MWVPDVGAVPGPDEASWTNIFHRNAAGVMLRAPLPSATRTWEQLPPPRVAISLNHSLNQAHQSVLQMVNVRELDCSKKLIHPLKRQASGLEGPRRGITSF